MATRFYSDEQFTNKVGDKPGNIRYFRKILRENDLLETRERLNDKHIQMFIAIKTYKEEFNCTWEFAIKEHIQKIVLDSTSRNIELENNALLREALDRIARIEEYIGMDEDEVESCDVENLDCQHFSRQLF